MAASQSPADAAVIYSVVDDRIFELLETAKAILTSTLSESQELLADLKAIEFGDRRHA